MGGDSFYRNKTSRVRFGENDTDTRASREVIWAQMLAMTGKEHTFEMARDAEVIARDGLDSSLSAGAVAHLGWLMSAWAGTRLMRTWMHDEIAPQKITVTVTVEVEGIPRLLIPAEWRP
jgi:hypothetical protein